VSCRAYGEIVENKLAIAEFMASVSLSVASSASRCVSPSCLLEARRVDLWCGCRALHRSRLFGLNPARRRAAAGTPVFESG
jgi:hypothetical protein